MTIFLGHPQRFQAWQRACILLESGFLMARRLPTTAPSVVLGSCSGRASRCCPSPNDRAQVSRDVRDRDCSANSDECQGVCRSRWNRSNIPERKGAKRLVCVNHVLSALSSIASVEGGGVLQLVLLGQGGLWKRRASKFQSYMAV